LEAKGTIFPTFVSYETKLLRNQKAKAVSRSLFLFFFVQRIMRGGLRSCSCPCPKSKENSSLWV